MFKSLLLSIAISVPVSMFAIGSQSQSLFVKGPGDGKKAKSDLQIINKWDMPETLKEISGIAWMKDGKFACVQDEIGSIYIYDTKSNAIDRVIVFGGPGDYEGLTLAGNDAYIMRSDGLIFEVQDINSKSPVLKQYRTHLTAKQNVEGLTYDQKNNRLLAAIKGPEAQKESYKGIYAFDLATKTMSTTPVFKIDLTNNVFGETKAKKMLKAMQPSEIAVHPLTGEIYISDAIGPKLIVMDPTGTIKTLYKMNIDEFAQAEGMSFSPDGKLYISNEGKSEPANILEVEIKK